MQYGWEHRCKLYRKSIQSSKLRDSNLVWLPKVARLVALEILDDSRRLANKPYSTPLICDLKSLLEWKVNLIDHDSFRRFIGRLLYLTNITLTSVMLFTS